MGELEYRGTWWEYPSYLESPVGPWGGYEKYWDEPVIMWKRAIDWMADKGFNFVITGIPPYRKDPVKQGWGFHYVLDFENCPEARVFGKDFTARNRRMLREIFTYARKRGLMPYIYHYNLLAPVPFVKAHTSILRKYRFARDFSCGKMTTDSLGNIWGNVCWNERAYQDFMIGCWQEFIKEIPETAGIMVAPGEYNRCGCPKCWQNMETTAHFARTFSTVLEEEGKRPLVRTWFCGGSPEQMPGNITYVLKTTVFDCIDCGLDPLVESWINAGHRVWLSHELYGENAGPIVWTNPGYFHKVIKQIQKLPVEGLMSFHNSDLSFHGLKTKSQQANLEMYAHYINRTEPYDEERWADYFVSHWGRMGKDIFEALKCISDVVLNISKVIFTEGEGYTWSCFYPFRGPTSFPPKWPKDIGLAEPPSWGPGPCFNPPEWCRADIVSLQEYIDYLKKSPWRKDLLKLVAGKRPSVLDLLARMSASAQKAIDTLNGKENRVKDELKTEYRILSISAYLGYCLAEEWRHFVKARIYYAGLKSKVSQQTKRKLARQCLSELGGNISCLQRQLERVLELPDGFYDYWKHVWIEDRSRIWFHTLTVRINIRKGELNEIAREFKKQRIA